MASLLRGLRTDDEIRVLVLTGAGAAFSSGGDAEFLSGNAFTNRNDHIHPVVVHDRRRTPANLGLPDQVFSQTEIRRQSVSFGDAAAVRAPEPRPVPGVEGQEQQPHGGDQAEGKEVCGSRSHRLRV